MSDATLDHPAPRKKFGRRWIIIVLGAFMLAFPIILASFTMMTDYGIKGDKRLRAMVTIRELQMAISTYHIEYNRYPLPSSVLSNADSKDVSMRSRGPMLPMLIGDETKPLIPPNPTSMNPKDIRFIDLPKAMDHKSGTWQDGSELVLSDPWGEPFYIVLDINGDNQIANPELRVDTPDSKDAAKGKTAPLPGMLPLEILV